MRYELNPGPPIFTGEGPRQGTTRIDFKGSVYLEPDEMDAYYRWGLAVHIGADAEPFSNEEKTAAIVANAFGLEVGDELHLFGSENAGWPPGIYEVTGKLPDGTPTMRLKGSRDERTD